LPELTTSAMAAAEYTKAARTAYPGQKTKVVGFSVIQDRIGLSLGYDTGFHRLIDCRGEG